MPYSSLWSSLARWWSSDRIRLPPGDGLLLRLAPASVVVIGDIAYEVIARRVVSLASGPAILYDCEAERLRGALRVEPASPRVRLAFIAAGTEIPLAEEDVEIFPARGFCPR